MTSRYAAKLLAFLFELAFPFFVVVILVFFMNGLVFYSCFPRPSCMSGYTHREVFSLATDLTSLSSDMFIFDTLIPFLCLRLPWRSVSSFFWQTLVQNGKVVYLHLKPVSKFFFSSSSLEYNSSLEVGWFNRLKKAWGSAISFVKLNHSFVTYSVDLPFLEESNCYTLSSYC